MDVADFLRLVTKPSPTRDQWLESLPAKKIEQRLGFNLRQAEQTERVVYFIRAQETSEMKIGTCGRDRVAQRLTELRCGNAHELRCVGLLPGSSHVERILHRRFKSFHIRGEWFLYTPDMHGILTAAFYAYGFCMSCARIHFRPSHVDADEHDCIARGFIKPNQPQSVWV